MTVTTPSPTPGRRWTGWFTTPLRIVLTTLAAAVLLIAVPAAGIGFAAGTEVGEDRAEDDARASGSGSDDADDDDDDADDDADDADDDDDADDADDDDRRPATVPSDPASPAVPTMIPSTPVSPAPATPPVTPTA